MSKLMEAKIRDLNILDRSEFQTYLKGGRLPPVASLSRICRAGLVVRRGEKFVSVAGVHEAMAQVLARASEGMVG